MTPPAVLVVDDDLTHREQIVVHLRRMKFAVLHAGTKDEALNVLQRHEIDVVLLEMGLGSEVDPDAGLSTESASMPGLELLEILRSSQPYTPVIVVTYFSKTIYELMAVRSGADAFLRKPADLNLLTAYIRGKLGLSAQIRSNTIAAPANGSGVLEGQRTVLTVGRLIIDTRHRLVRVGDAPYQNLSALELKLLALLAELPDKVFSRHELLERVWGVDAYDSYDAVDATIKRIRRKIEPGMRKSRHLISVRGLGYRLSG